MELTFFSTKGNVKGKDMKIRNMTPAELKSVRIQQYDTGFSLWINQPGMKNERCILDASLLLENGHMRVVPPVKHPNGTFTYGSIITNDEITLVAVV